MKKGYIAGKLFKQGDIGQRIYEGHLVGKELPHINFYNPIANDEINDKNNLPTAEEVYDGDTDRVIESEYILAELDDEDSGTMFELGVCNGIEIMRDKVKYLRDKYGDLTIDELLPLLEEEVPKKKVYAHLSDIRLGTANQYESIYIPHGINQYVIGGVEKIGEIYGSVEEAVEGIKKDLE